MPPTRLQRLPRVMKLPGTSRQLCMTPWHPIWETSPCATESVSSCQPVFGHPDTSWGKRSCCDIIEMVVPYSSALSLRTYKTVSAERVNLWTTMSQRLKASRISTASLTASSLSFRPHEVIGRAYSQSPLWPVIAAWFLSGYNNNYYYYYCGYFCNWCEVVCFAQHCLCLAVAITKCIHQLAVLFERWYAALE